MTVTSGSTDWVVWAAAGAPIPGQITSGDGYLVVPRPLRTLIAVMDGLGHGPDAHEATSAAIAAIAETLTRHSGRCLSVATRRCSGPGG